jgi:hypothetical protein
MKKLITFGFLLLGVNSFSQTFTADEFFLIDDSMKTVDVSDTGYTAPTYGSSQTWDFSALKRRSTITSYKYIKVQDATNGSKFTGANIVEKKTGTGIGGAASYTFFNRTGSVLEVVGTDATQQQIPYTDKATWIKFPISYTGNANNTDQFAATYKLVLVNVARTGTSTSFGQGNGTLKLPGNITYNNAVLIEVDIEQTDSSNFLGQDLVIPTSSKTWYWYVSGRRGWVFQVAEVTTAVGGSPQTVRTISMRDTSSNVSSNVFSNVNSLNIFPNPASHQAQINFELANAENISYKLTDLAGKCYWNKQVFMQAGVHSQTIPMNNLATGIYLVQVNNSIIKLVIE